MEWKLGDRVINRKSGQKQHIVNVEFWNSKVNQEGWINKSLIGRKAYKTFFQTHKRGPDGTFKRKSNIDEIMKAAKAIQDAEERAYREERQKGIDWTAMEKEIGKYLWLPAEARERLMKIIKSYV